MFPTFHATGRLQDMLQVNPKLFTWQNRACRTKRHLDQARARRTYCQIRTLVLDPPGMTQASCSIKCSMYALWCCQGQPSASPWQGRTSFPSGVGITSEAPADLCPSTLLYVLLVPLPSTALASLLMELSWSLAACTPQQHQPQYHYHTGRRDCRTALQQACCVEGVPSRRSMGC